jgi:Fe-S-cluster containining protein
VTEHPENPHANSGAAPEWYRDGLRFECTQCGNCCTGGPGAVWFTPSEGRAMAEKLGLDEAAFLERYTRRIGVRRSLIERRTEFGHDCIFLDRSTRPGKAICGLYEARPMQCRTWPFWPENLESATAWTEVKERTPCPGMNKGTLHSLVTIRVQRDLDRKREAFGEEQ